MSELKPCPCGKTPQRLEITDAGQGGKWACVEGGCCGEWSIEFRTQYHDLPSRECLDLAAEAWNEAPRAAPAPQAVGCEYCQGTGTIHETVGEQRHPISGDCPDCGGYGQTAPQATDALRGLLKAAKCPDPACKDGAVHRPTVVSVAACCNRTLENGECCGYPEEHPEYDWECVRCQWCAEREQALLTPEQGEWLPIESAPKEECVLVAFDEPFFGTFTNEVEVAYYDSHSSKWRFNLTDREIKGVTHWQPLTAPPQDTQEGE